MRPCKRGGFGPRDKHGICRCDACNEFNRAQWRLRNVERAGYREAWRKENSDRVRAYSQKWVANNTKQRREIEKDWRRRNPEKVKAMNAKAGAKWSTTNKGKRNAITRKRAAVLLQRTPSWADLAAIQAFYVEAARLTAETGTPHEVDHFYPLQGELVSGLHVEGNLRITTRYRNRSKQNRFDVDLMWDLEIERLTTPRSQRGQQGDHHEKEIESARLSRV
ncbi:hypothetical protein [Bradyrhizobium sp. 2S1]|uniref:hypothetical protein n=1 Tax=Bradyrhizobium sp. 2S1 TaxID=1404429 RepID=UPI00140E845E|nr:hypothetical protein [Bradyrhizobium sp. 2S1]MCK7669154.1 hypothetical protein [Bradyrhizobium sp. 2S1]